MKITIRKFMCKFKVAYTKNGGPTETTGKQLVDTWEMWANITISARVDPGEMAEQLK